MVQILLLNKPFDVLCQFTDEQQRDNLSNYITGNAYHDYYAAGRLDRDSEGLVVLTNNGKLQNHIASPKFKLPKTYWVQVEGDITTSAITQLILGVELKDGKTRPSQCQKLPDPNIWERTPPIRERKNIPTSWISLTIIEGKNRQVRRMTAAVGFPTLRLIRYSVGDWSIEGIPCGQFTTKNIEFTEQSEPNPARRQVKTYVKAGIRPKARTHNAKRTHTTQKK